MNASLFFWKTASRVAAILSVPLFLGVGPRSQPASDLYDVIQKKDVMVPMRDGVRLATDIYFPGRNGQAVAEKLPVILSRTPYNKEAGGASGSETPQHYYASHGYVVVFQDCRGRFKSEGTWHWISDDGPDGFDTAKWIGQQPWSNGSIGMFGTSYPGGTQHALALEKAPELKTVIPIDALSNQGYASTRNGGAFELRQFNWAFTNGPASWIARKPELKAALEELRDNRLYYVQQLPLRRGTTPLKLIPEYENWLVEAMKRGRAHDEYWLANNIIDNPSRYKDIPVLLKGGWYDSWGLNTSANFQALTKTIKGPVYLIMGPWTHGGEAGYAHGQVTFGKDAAIADPLAWRLEWYDRWLKGKQNTVGTAPPFRTKVRIFVMGTGDERKDAEGRQNHGGYWRDENEWPLARTQYTNYYLGDGGALTTTPPKAERSSTAYVFDPRNPVPTIGGNISSAEGIAQAGAWDQRGNEKIWNWLKPVPLSARNDVLVFQTEPLQVDTEVTGEITVKLWASSSAVDTDFTAKLIDVHPPNTDFPAGFDQNIEDGIFRARFRDSLDEEHMMEPGKAYEFTIKMYPTSNIFKRGHRIRVDVSSSNFPRFDVNSNTGEPLNDNRRWVTATNTVFHDRDHPSHIVLPVIPATKSSER